MTYLILTLAAVAAVTAWLLRLRWWPYGRCPACQGRKGRGTGSSPRAWSRCSRCGGSGERLRPGARIWQRNRKDG
jgi:hypothetical protein